MSEDTLRTLFEVFEQTDLTQALSKAFGAYIVDAGLTILAKVNSSMDERTLSSHIDRIIELKVRIDSILACCFKDRKMLK